MLTSLGYDLPCLLVISLTSRFPPKMRRKLTPFAAPPPKSMRRTAEQNRKQPEPAEHR